MIPGLASRFDEVLAELGFAAGWRTACRQRPVVIKGRLDGILTTVRNQQRTAALEMHEVETEGGPIRVPTPA